MAKAKDKEPQDTPEQPGPAHQPTPDPSERPANEPTLNNDEQDKPRS